MGNPLATEEQKTDYQAVYFSLKGIEGYFAMKIANDEEVKLGKEVELYLPYSRLTIYDEEHNKVFSRELLYPNMANASVTNKNGQMHIKTAGTTLVFPDNSNYPDGEYRILFKQDKLLPIYSKKLLKSGLQNPKMDNPKNRIKVSAYDEDVLGTKLLAYVQVNGMEKYASFVMDNKFSVYKMPKFELYVPEDGFELMEK